MSLHDYSLFEECVANIFCLCGYSVERNVLTEKAKGDIDIVAEKEGVTFYVEVKYVPVNDRVAMQINRKAELCGTTPVLVTAYPINDAIRLRHTEKYPNLVLLDIANLLFAVEDDVQLRNQLISALPYSVESIEPKQGFLQSDTIMHSDNYTESLIGEMRLCMPRKPMASRFEEVCKLLLENIFSEDLALWKVQQKSNKDLYRFDLLCRIKEGNQKTFWSILEKFFNSKYIVFEFKSYTDKVTQKEIYTTEKYLYAKALRSVGIIIAANGYDENAYWAAKGSLRENGKLIMLLDTEDLIKMNQMKIEQDDPADYLLSKLDDLLLELEK